MIEATLQNEVEVFLKDTSSIEGLLKFKQLALKNKDVLSKLNSVLKSFKEYEKDFPTESKMLIRKGVGYYIISDLEKAKKYLVEATSSLEKDFFLAKVYYDLNEFSNAEELFKKLFSGGNKTIEILSGLIESKIRMMKIDEAIELLEKQKSKFYECAEYFYLLGLCSDFQNQYEKAKECYKKCLTIDPNHPKSLFRQAYIADLEGQDEYAKEIYEKLVYIAPNANLYINLGLVYEDMDKLDKALWCYEQVLKYDPKNQKALLYKEDVIASQMMVYDSDLRKKEDRWHTLLMTTISSLSLTARTKNCLYKLAINTIGDLIARTEESLLETKALGQNTIKELKEFMKQRGLNFASTQQEADSFKNLVEKLKLKGKEEIIKRPILDFEWSVRAKKCFEQLNIKTVQDILLKTERELLETKNFGLTTLNEIKQKLGQFGIQLKKEK